jgi:hypothetical protein
MTILPQTRSLRALRRLLIAFRSAVRMNEGGERDRKGGWRIEEATGVPFIVTRLHGFSNTGFHTSFQQACRYCIQVYACSA